MRVVLVEHAGLPVVDHQGGIADGPVRRRHQRQDRQAEAAHVDRLGVLRVDELREAEGPQCLLQVVEGVVGEEDPGVLRHVLGQELRIEVVVVEVGDVQVVGPADQVSVDPLIAREGEPGSEEGRVEPGVAQDAAVAGLHEQSRLPQERDPHHRPRPRRYVAGFVCSFPAGDAPERAAFLGLGPPGNERARSHGPAITLQPSGADSKRRERLFGGWRPVDARDRGKVGQT